MVTRKYWNMTPGRWEPNEVSTKIFLDKCLGAAFELWVQKNGEGAGNTRAC